MTQVGLDVAGLDVVGDVHGCHGSLQALLRELGYRRDGDRWSHPEGRMVVFIGDYIDRGENPWDTYRCVRSLCEQGVALAILGNHDTNALAFSTRVSDGRFEPERAFENARCALKEPESAETGWVRNHKRPSNLAQHKATLRNLDQAQYAEVLTWLRRLPAWIDLPFARFVHAAWIRPSIDMLASFAVKPCGAAVGLSAPTLSTAKSEFHRRLADRSSRLSDTDWLELLNLRVSDASACPPNKDTAVAFERILKGVEIGIPDGRRFKDIDEHERSSMRSKWFDPAAGRMFHEHLLGRKELRAKIERELPGLAIPRPNDQLYPYDPSDAYGEHEPPVFFGHYGLMREDAEALLRRNCVCVDHSGFDAQGLLSAYRFDVGRPIEPAGFVSVTPVDPAPRHEGLRDGTHPRRPEP